MAKVVVDQEFKDCLPTMKPQERKGLETEIIKAGKCRDPLKIWKGKGILLDGHNRFEICTEHKLPFETEEVELADRDAAKEWILEYQLSRRNLTDDQEALYRGRLYNLRKLPVGGDKKSNVHNEHSIGDNGQTTAEKLAEEHGVSPMTIRRDAEFAESVDALKKVDSKLEKKVIDGEAPAKAKIVKAAKALEAGDKKAAKAILAGEDVPPPEPADPPAWKPTKDKSGTPIPKSLESAFQHDEKFRQILDIHLLEAGKLVIELGRAKVVPPAMLELIRNSFAMVAVKLKGVRPYKVCTDCKGEKCKHCGNRGYYVQPTSVKK